MKNFRNFTQHNRLNLKNLLTLLLVICLVQFGATMPRIQKLTLDSPVNKITICVSIGIITVCWEIDLDEKTPPMALPKGGLQGEVTKNTMTITGFAKRSEGTVMIIRERQDLVPSCERVSSKYVILPGQYKINNGQCVFKLAQKSSDIK